MVSGSLRPRVWRTQTSRPSSEFPGSRRQNSAVRFLQTLLLAGAGGVAWWQRCFLFRFPQQLGVRLYNRKRAQDQSEAMHLWMFGAPPPPTPPLSQTFSSRLRIKAELRKRRSLLFSSCKRRSSASRCNSASCSCNQQNTGWSWRGDTHHTHTQFLPVCFSAGEVKSPPMSHQQGASYSRYTQILAHTHTVSLSPMQTDSLM